MWGLRICISNTFPDAAAGLGGRALKTAHLDDCLLRTNTRCYWHSTTELLAGCLAPASPLFPLQGASTMKLVHEVMASSSGTLSKRSCGAPFLHSPLTTYSTTGRWSCSLTLILKMRKQVEKKITCQRWYSIRTNHEMAAIHPFFNYKNGNFIWFLCKQGLSTLSRSDSKA